MKWMIVASLTITVFLAPAYGQQAGQAAGTCASIDYSTACCPPSENCVVGSGSNECGCGSDCHAFDDCCSDAACPRSKYLIINFHNNMPEICMVASA